MQSRNIIPECVAAIPAQVQVHPPTILQPLLSMARWNKPELTLFLRSHGEEPPWSWTKVQLKHRIYDMIERGEAEAPSHKKSKTPLQLMIGEMNRMSQKKATLIKYAEEEHKLKVTPNDAINSIQRRLLNHFMSTVTPVGEDMMGFGKQAAVEQAGRLDDQPLAAPRAPFGHAGQQFLGHGIAVVAGQKVGAGDAGMGHQRFDQVGLIVDAIAVADRLGGKTESDHVRRDDAETGGQRRPDQMPVPRAGGKAVQTQQHRPLAPLLIENLVTPIAEVTAGGTPFL